MKKMKPQILKMARRGIWECLKEKGGMRNDVIVLYLQK